MNADKARYNCNYMATCLANMKAIDYIIIEELQ